MRSNVHDLPFTSLFQPTTTVRSERLLANSLGYPKSWHVRRVRLSKNTDETEWTYQDVIYTGDPGSKVDVYFNHIAAMEAALSWKEGESTGFDNKGGQLLPLVAAYNKGESVQVYFEKDREWYDAVVTKVKMYNDDVRYTVHYTTENSTQSNISEDIMRKVDPDAVPCKKLKKGRSAASPSKKTSAPSDSSKKKRKQDVIIDSKARRKSSTYTPNPDELDLAHSMGLPDGWTAKSHGKGMYSFRSPDGQTRIDGKKAVFQHLGIDNPRSFYPRSSKSSKNIQYKELDDGVEEYDEMSQDISEAPVKKPSSAASRKEKRSRAAKEDEFWKEEGVDNDPPWRITGHEFIGKKIVVDENQGIVVGWISETDVDKNGQPGYVSESDGKPAALFHVQFDDSNREIESQDFEEFEILNYVLHQK